MVLVLTPNDTRGLVSFGDAIDAFETAFRDWARNQPPGGLRQRVHAPGGARILLHQGIAYSANALGIAVHCEMVHVADDDRQRFSTMGSPVRVVFDAESAELRAIVIGELYPEELPDSHAVVGLPTAAASAVGTKLLARQDATTLGLLGAGTQARYHLVASCKIRAIERVRVYSPTRRNREAFAEEMRGVTGIDVQAVDHAEEAVAGADIVMLATDTTAPVLDGAWLAEGAHVTSIVWSSSPLQKRRELDDTTLKRASLVVTNSLEQVAADQGADLWDTVEQGILSRDKLVDLGQLLRGEAPGRSSAEEITVFKNCAFWGMGDQAVASLLVQRAEERGLGTRIEAPVAQYR